MAALRDLGLFDRSRGDAVAILVGPNGSGKSTYLRALAETHRRDNVIVISNTPHDRFAGMKGIRRISAGRSYDTPENVVKRAVTEALDLEDSSFFQISTIMNYRGYAPRFGFRAVGARRYGSSFDDLQIALELGPANPAFKGVSGDVGQYRSDDLHRALSFLSRHEPADIIWIDASRSALEFSRSRDFAAVLRCEAILRRLEVVDRMQVMLQRQDHEGEVIEIRSASSGQLALISSLLFLITKAGDHPIILVDEPENSLHPSWQREYVDKVMTAMAYRGATLIVATHAPLIVTGAIGNKRNELAVFRVHAGQATRLNMRSFASPSSIEEILWEAFSVVTPANHFVSEEIVAAISRFEEDQITKHDLLSLVDRLEERSLDEQQKRFFSAVRLLIDKVERAKAGLDDGEDIG